MIVNRTCYREPKKGNQHHHGVKNKYQGLPYVSSGLLEFILAQQRNVDEARRGKLFATGLERGNSSIGYVALSTLFLREHNRLCAELDHRNPHWEGDDERLFQTARLSTS